MIIGACFPELCGFSTTCNEHSTLTLAHAQTVASARTRTTNAATIMSNWL